MLYFKEALDKPFLHGTLPCFSLPIQMLFADVSVALFDYLKVLGKSVGG